MDGVGLSIAGFLNKREGMLMASPNLPFKNFEIVQPLNKYLQKPIIFSNDANAAAMGEKVWGAAKELRYFIYLTMSSGIGGAAFMDGELMEQDNGNGIEPGHIKVSSGYDLPCGCGGKDHWESYASGTNMPNFLNAWAEKNGHKLDFDGSDIFDIFRAIKSGDETAVKFFDEVIKVNAKGMNMLTNKYHPQLIIVGGSVFLNNKELFTKNLSLSLPPDVELLPATFGDDASLVGSAAFFLQKTALL